MTMNASDGAANAYVRQTSTMFPAGSLLEMRSGARPASAHDRATGTLLALIVLPSEPWAAEATRRVTKSGEWSAKAVAAGDVGWARLRRVGDLETRNPTDERLDFTVTGSGEGGDLEVDNVNLAFNQPVSVTSLYVQVG